VPQVIPTSQRELRVYCKARHVRLAKGQADACSTSADLFMRTYMQNRVLASTSERAAHAIVLCKTKLGLI
jgi:hypothetical protein